MSVVFIKGDTMKRLTAALISITFILSAAACGKKATPESSSETLTSVTTTAASTTASETESESAAETTKTPTGEFTGPTRATEAPDYGSTRTADLCELMHSITGKRVYQAVALVEDFFKSGFESNYMQHSTSYKGGKGEEVYTHYYYMKISSDELAFNRFIFIANEEYGIVYAVEFYNSNSKHDNSLKPSEYTQDDMRKYYSRLEKEMTDCFGNPSKRALLNDKNLFSPAYSVYEKGECTFSVYYNSSDEDEVSVTCLNNVERKHFIRDTDHEPFDEDKNHIKEHTKDDIAQDEKTGTRYVKNQLLVSIKMGTPDARKKMEDICKEIDAEIVGALETTKDYQIEFKHDMTYDELMKLGKELTDKYYFISDVSLNIVFDISYD